VPFLTVSASEFMEMFVGVGASRVRNLFEEARKASPAIIFIDELDSIGRRRGAGIGGGHDEREQTLNQILSEMDGFEKDTSVIIIAATNRPDILDPALMRPGRFDRQVTIGLPTLREREEILKVHVRNKPVDDEVDLHRLAESTPMFSGADLENLTNEAALIAARTNKHVISWTDFNEALDRITLGLRRGSLVPTEEERKLLAYHEAGHAVAYAAQPELGEIRKVTISPRGGAGGFMAPLSKEEMFFNESRFRSSWWSRSAAAWPRSASPARSRRAPATTSSRPPRWPSRWCSTWAWAARSSWPGGPTPDPCSWAARSAAARTSPRRPRASSRSR
jgi:cell division protease FtsH